MKKVIILAFVIIPGLMSAQENEQSVDPRDAFLGRYACTGLPWVPPIHTWPIMYISVQKSLTDSTKLLFEDSTRNGDGPTWFSHVVPFFPEDSTYYKDIDYFGDFKKQDTIHMINVVPTVGGYNIYCPKVLTSDVGEMYMQEKVMVFPNPFTDELYLVTPWPSGEMAAVEVYDAQGQCVFRQQYNGITNGCKLNLGFLSPGIYSVKITGEKLHVVKKIVKTE